MPRSFPISPETVIRVAADLSGTGVAIVTGLFPAPLLADLGADARRLSAAGALVPAATGRGSGRQTVGLRGDSTLWLDDAACAPVATDFLASLDVLRIELNRALLLGLHDVEAHYALYPPGAGYARHRDRFRDDDARVVSLVSYLNADWLDSAGGHLRLHLPEGSRDIAPQVGTTVLFLSDEVEHEVLAATRERLSIAAWFRTRA